MKTVKNKPGPRRGRLPAAVVVCLLMLINGLFVYLYLILPQGPFNWDEAHRSVFSYLVSHSLFTGRWSDFWRFTNAQTYWPFLHSWATAPFLLWRGYSYAAARLMSLCFFLFSIPLICFCGARLEPRRGAAVGLLAVLMLTASPLFSFMAATAMAESLGSALTLAAFTVGLSILDKSKKSLFFLLGVLLTLLYFTKYEFSFFFGLGLALFGLGQLPTRRGRSWLKENVVGIVFLAAGFLMPVGCWLAFPLASQKVGVILYRIRDTGGWNFLQLGPLDRILFYPRALLGAYTFSPWIFLAYLGGLAWAVYGRREIKRRFLLCMFVATLAPMAVSVNLQERFILTAMPVLFLFASAVLVAGWFRVPARFRAVAAAIVLALVAGDLHKMPRYIKTVGNTTLGALNFRASALRPRTFLFGLAELPSFFGQPKNLLLPKLGDPVPEKTMNEVFEYIWSVVPAAAPLSAMFQLNCASPHLWRWHALALHRPLAIGWHPEAVFFVAARLADNSVYRTMANESLIANEVETDLAFLQDQVGGGAVYLYSSRVFPDMGLEILIYARPPQADRRFGRLDRTSNPD